MRFPLTFGSLDNIIFMKNSPFYSKYILENGIVTCPEKGMAILIDTFHFSFPSRRILSKSYHFGIIVSKMIKEYHLDNVFAKEAFNFLYVVI